VNAAPARLPATCFQREISAVLSAALLPSARLVYGTRSTAGAAAAAAVRVGRTNHYAHTSSSPSSATSSLLAGQRAILQRRRAATFHAPRRHIPASQHLLYGRRYVGFISTPKKFFNFPAVELIDARRASSTHLCVREAACYNICLTHNSKFNSDVAGYPSRRGEVGQEL